MSVLGSGFAKATLGFLVYRLKLYKIDNHLRAIVGVPANEWSPWAPQWYIDDFRRRTALDLARAENSNQRHLIIHYGCTLEDAQRIERNFEIACEKALGESLGDVREFLPLELSETDRKLADAKLLADASGGVALRTIRRRRW